MKTGKQGRPLPGAAKPSTKTGAGREKAATVGIEDEYEDKGG